MHTTLLLVPVFKNPVPHYADPHYANMKRFIRQQTEYIKAHSDGSDLTALEESFQSQNMSLLDAVTRMKLVIEKQQLRNPKTMAELYGISAGAVHIVEAKVINHEGKAVREKMPVEEKLKRYLMTKYACEIDCAIIKNEDDEQDDCIEEVHHE